MFRPAILEFRPNSLGIGIAGIRQRVKEFDGSLSITNIETGGPPIEVVIPAERDGATHIPVTGIDIDTLNIEQVQPTNRKENARPGSVRSELLLGRDESVSCTNNFFSAVEGGVPKCAAREFGRLEIGILLAGFPHEFEGSSLIA